MDSVREKVKGRKRGGGKRKNLSNRSVMLPMWAFVVAGVLMFPVVLIACASKRRKVAPSLESGMVSNREGGEGGKNGNATETSPLIQSERGGGHGKKVPEALDLRSRTDSGEDFDAMLENASLPIPCHPRLSSHPRYRESTILTAYATKLACVCSSDAALDSTHAQDHVLPWQTECNASASSSSPP